MDTLEKKSVLERIDCATEQIENVVMSLGLLTISGIVFANVIARYFFCLLYTSDAADEL